MNQFFPSILICEQTTVELSGISLVTIAFAPIVTLFPIFTFPRIFAPAPILQLSPIQGVPPPELPIVTCCHITQLDPICAYK